MRAFNTPLKFWFPLFRTNLCFRFSAPAHDSTLSLILRRLQEQHSRSKQMEQDLINQALGEHTGGFINPEKTRMEINRLAPIVAKYEQLSAVLKNIQDLNQMRQQVQDQEEKELIEEEVKELEKKKQDLKEEAIGLMVPPDMYDDCQEVTLEFRAAAGGSQSSLFVEDFSNTILNFCGSMGWRTTTISTLKDTSIGRGIRSMTVKVQGHEVYKILKCQSGVHKVIRVPETENKGRLHSSTISLVVMPSVPFDFTINDRDIKYEYMKSSGPGGQSVNKTESACRATHLPSGMSVFIQQDRSQDRNKKRATDILKERLFEIEYQKNIEEEVRKRKSQMGTMDRSEKIRTYNYPQDRITDHRTGLTLFGIESMMAGEYLLQFIQAYQEKMHSEKLRCLLDELKTSS